LCFALCCFPSPSIPPRSIRCPYMTLFESVRQQSEREVAPALFLSLLRELIFEPALQFGLVRMELDCVDFIHELLQLVCWNVVPHRFINTAVNLMCGIRPDDSLRFTATE